jgi:hypothetical protein
LKVTKLGNINTQEFTAKRVCSGSNSCGSELEYVLGDLRDDSNQKTLSFNCPICGCSQDVTEELKRLMVTTDIVRKHKEETLCTPV